MFPSICLPGHCMLHVLPETELPRWGGVQKCMVKLVAARNRRCLVLMEALGWCMGFPSWEYERGV